MDKSVFLLGGGSSVAIGIALSLWDKIKDIEVWSLNFGFLFMPYFPKREVWVDSTFFRNNKERLKKLSDNGVELHARKHESYKNIKEIKQYDIARTYKKVDENKIFTGTMGLVGAFALHLAIKEGYSPIYLSGFDFGTPHYQDTNTHFYQDKVAEMGIKSSGIASTQVYLLHTNLVKPAVQDWDFFKQFSNQIFDVSPKSNLTQFKKIDYQTMFEIMEKKNE